MNISNFEQYVNPIIAMRGLEYFKEQKVEDIETVGDHLYDATVAGSEVYSVEVQIQQDGSILNAECDCPYTAPTANTWSQCSYALRADRKRLNGTGASPATKRTSVTKCV